MNFSYNHLKLWMDGRRRTTEPVYIITSPEISAQVQSYLRLVCESRLPRFCVTYTKAGHWKGCMPKKLKFYFLPRRELEP